MSSQPSRPPLEADDTPIGRDWVEWAKHLEAENQQLREALERIRDWRGFRHTGEVRDCAGDALAAVVEEPFVVQEPAPEATLERLRKRVADDDWTAEE